MIFLQLLLIAKFLANALTYKNLAASCQKIPRLLNHIRRHVWMLLNHIRTHVRMFCSLFEMQWADPTTPLTTSNFYAMGNFRLSGRISVDLGVESVAGIRGFFLALPNWGVI